ncbi:MAG: GMP synthase (glutamine-hydrolyzing), partial [Burkholderiaceae bacterium]|nr:GMP synthase (glutamine-hydrolyzing) [Burkholderiaceae bacterium]
MHSRILILDFGSQVTQLIARRVREAGVFCEIHPSDVSDDFVRHYGKVSDTVPDTLKGIILSGSHLSVTEAGTLRAPDAVFSRGVPVLGICYGMQTMASQLGGRVEAGAVRE